MNPAALVYVVAAVLVLDARTARVVAAYILLAGFVAYESAAAAWGSAQTGGLFALSTLMKLVLAPIGIGVFLARNPAARELRPGLPLPVRLAIVLALALGAREAGRMPEFAATALVGPAVFIIVSGLAALVVHRSLLGSLIGLLALGTGITLAGTAIAPTLPEPIELGAAFDALVVTFVGLALARAFVAHNPLLDVAALRRLRG